MVKTGGGRIVHRGDNRHNPPDEIWKAVGNIDIALLTVDASQHVMGHVHVDAIIQRLKPRVVVPHHYYIWDVLPRQSNLQTAEAWVSERDVVERIAGPKKIYRLGELDKLEGAVHYFGEHVNFDKAAWMDGA